MHTECSRQPAWQEVALTGAGRADYNETSWGFGSSAAEGTSGYFVYQTLSQGATLTIRVQTLTAISPNGEVGLVLRQSNDLV